MSYQTIATEIRDRILTITLSRPDRLNAFNSTMLEELLGVLDDADADDEVRAILFTGAGRGYCAGADLGGGGGSFDGGPEDVEHRLNLALEICRDHRGLHLGRSLGRSWKRDRFAQPYLRDDLLDNGVLVDTLETATTWSNLMSVYQAMTAVMKNAIAATGGGPGAVLTHVSHAYPYGASLYSTFLGRQVSSDPLENQEQWRTIKRETTDAIHTLHPSAARARQLLGWFPVHDLESSIAETVAWHRALRDRFDPPFAGDGSVDQQLTVKRETKIG